MKLSVLLLVVLVAFPYSGSAQITTDASGVFVLNSDDAPVELSDAQVVRSSGVPEIVRVTIKSRTQEPLILLKIDALVFNEKNTLRMQVFGGRGAPLAPGGVRVADIRIHHVDAKPGWKVVLSAKDANTPSRAWTVENEALKQKARASLESQG